jgi:dTMP kinase
MGVPMVGMARQSRPTALRSHASFADVALFVTFEGLDGSGKSTHLERASRWLAGRGVEHLVTHEPGGTVIGTAIRKVFLDRGHGAMDPRVELLLVFAARRQNLVERIEPALERGHHVLCDRWTDSTVAYQGHGRGISLADIAEVERLATGGRQPDLTLYFDLPAAAARSRGHSKHRRKSGRVDRLDAETLAFYDRVRAGYLDLARRHPARIRVIDSSGAVEATESAVREALTGLAALAAGVETP